MIDLISVFHPSLIFCSKINWENPQFRRDFMKNLLSHLDKIEELELKLAWSNEFLSYFMQNSPWKDSFYENDLCDVLYPSLSKFFEIIPQSCKIECNVNPYILNDVSDEVRREWLILIHHLLHIQIKTFVVIGLDYNVQYDSITVSCNCDGNRAEDTYSIIKSPSEWFIKIDYMYKCPSCSDGWEDNFKIAIRLCHEQGHKFKDYKTKLENIDFSNNFKTRFLELDTSKRKHIIQTIEKLLTLTHAEAGNDGGLREKNINGIYEIRISRGDRIFYNENEGKKIFINYIPASRHI